MKTFPKKRDPESDPAAVYDPELRDQGQAGSPLRGDDLPQQKSIEDLKRKHDLPSRLAAGNRTRDEHLKLIRLLTEQLEQKAEAESRARREMEALHSQIAKQKAKLDKQAADLAELKARVNRIVGSVSWKVTRPIRFVHRLLQRIKAKAS